ncbi:prolipoprotein diacylglyceryl transferase [Chelativorans salis]|uniref:Phosphatidylglycerol--prolipoprotein diacylglyceryl transferase n=1 Tax=Chelativorans salis TaxID=2978478 RepID=A0ABT2LJN5_9HYPH|nr:prolipoprotein diacylglyceryl transferase [Chelativorans sp. EGI FJ00035]MCT7374811.1 prolipoprotein diacylglyceryl transferase [Chelativorans sp. EGI FJ00035]
MSDYLLLPLAALPFPQIDPVIFEIGPFAVHWYGLGYIAGILFAWWYAKRLVTTERLWAHSTPPMKPTDLDDFVVWAAVGVVLGGRLGYVLFYDLPRYLANPLDIFAVWQGGMSFHGGMLGTILAMVLFARSRGINAWSMLDTIAATAPVGLGLVRLANFINSELWGRPTDMPWGVVFPDGGPLPRHPSQLYEAVLEGLVLFLVLRVLTHKALRLKTPRFVGGAFICGYGLSRIFVEFFREPDAHIGYLAGGWMTMGMVLSMPMVLAGLWAMMTARTPAAARQEP